MKAMAAVLMTLSISGSIFASDLNEKALQTLLSAPSVTLVGDVHSYETIGSIYGSAIGEAKINNDCKASVGSAYCTLWITYPLGETALEYEVDVSGERLLSAYVNVVRGD